MPPTASLGISDDQRFALIKFRRSVADCLKPEHDDHFLLRWLHARNWNPDAAEKMLRDSLKWREVWKVDELLDWEPPEVIKKYYPSGICGYDNEGSPVIVVPFAGLDMWGMVHSAPRSDFVRQTLKILETLIKAGHEQSEKHGFVARKVVAVIDMDGFNIRQYAWRPAGELIVSLVKMYESNYPEILKNCYIVNVPKMFSIAFSVIKNFLNDYTISKIQIYKADRKKWVPVLLQNINENQLPQYFGGTMVDENGDPKCSAMIAQGGKIPKSYYRGDKTEQKFVGKEFVNGEVKKGSRLCLDYEAVDAGCILKWEFRLEHYDIKFGIMRLENGEEVEEVPLHRVSCHEPEEIGVLTSRSPAKYRIIFDNTYSYLRTKKIQYSIQILPPLVATDQQEFITKQEISCVG